MIKDKLEKKGFDNINGLSCLENYTTYALKREGINYSLLYYKRWLPLFQIIEEFLEKKVSFAEFYKVKRLQKVAEELGIIKTLEQDKYLTDITEEWNNYDYWMVKVKEEFIKKQYSTQLLRNDHYILVSYKNDNEFFYLNDTPRDEGNISYNSLEKIISPKIYAFSIIPDIKLDVKELKKIFLKSVIEDDLKIEVCIDNNIDIELIRDILGILKIIRKQAVMFCDNFFNTNKLSECLGELENYYALMEYMRLRRKVSYRKIKEIFEEIIFKDKKMREYIINEMHRD